MVRTRSMASIEAEISKVEADLAKAQEKCDALSAQLQDLKQQKKDAEAKQLMDAIKKSGKSIEELMSFLEA